MMIKIMIIVVDRISIFFVIILSGITVSDQAQFHSTRSVIFV